MRVLFTTLPASGHFHPLVPLARAALQAGHEVAFAAPASFCPAVERVGFRAYPAGFERGGVPLDELFPRMRTLTGVEFTRYVNGHIRLQVGLVLGPDERTPEAIRAAVRTVLSDPTYRRNARRVRDAMATLPGPEHGVALLEGLVAERRPLVSPL